jgi:hypothetical protein
MPLTTAGLDFAVNSVTGAAVWVGLTDAGGTEVGSQGNGAGSPAYARINITWNASSGGSATMADLPIQFDVPAGDTVSRFALYSASTGGTQYSIEDVSAAEGPYAAQGTYDLTAGSLTAT